MSEEAIIKLASLFIILLGLIALLMTLTVFFGAIRKLESHIATPGKQLDEIKKIWGNGPIGRWMRAVHLHMFFVFRRLPLYGKSIEARFGDETTHVPTRLKMTFMVPMF
ncbi:MAG TPA: hypothetical protein DHU56_15695 [Marinobacter sp.]|jgi:hypothetical protein|nr:hypothetical protein [Marinobacter sp.]